jgi:hypothetical protein
VAAALVHALQAGAVLLSCLLELARLDRGNQLLDVLDLEQAALMLVVRSASVGSPAFGRLPVAEIQRQRLFGGALSSQPEHA